MSQSLSLLKTRMNRILRLQQAEGLLGWDQQTYMPPGAAEARAEQSAALSEFAHELFTSDETGNLLAAAEVETKGLEPDSDDARTLALLRRNFDRATKLPSAFVAELTRHQGHSFQTWLKARENNDFASFIPAVEKMFDLTRQKAEYYGYQEHIYDALIDEFEQGATHASIAAMFADIKPSLVTLTRAIATSKNPVDDSLLHSDFPVEKQRELTLRLVQAVGFDLNRGRQDEAAHPFCANFGRDDVRLTTRYDTGYLGQGIYSSLHEAGHGMYEQGSPPEYEGTVLAGGTSLGVHESQSRMWENLVGRGRPFCRFAFPLIREAFPTAFTGALANADAETLYRAVNKVEPSLIRVEADEVTYNLHILLRFELESDLLTGRLAVRDLPAAWNAKMEAYLGLTPPSNANGCLQDVHWAEGLIGYFPTYSLGNLISGQLWHAARKALPDLDAQMERGEFAPLLGWLRENVHGYGSKFKPAEVIERATGEPLTSLYYADYLTAKYREIYAL
jgi:carboxypeptidase Taq